MPNTTSNYSNPEQLKRFLKLKQVKERTALSTSEIYRRIESGTFPKQIRLGAKAVAWLEHEITAWQEAVIDANTGSVK